MHDVFSTKLSSPLAWSSITDSTTSTSLCFSSSSSPHSLPLMLTRIWLMMTQRKERTMLTKKMNAKRRSFLLRSLLMETAAMQIMPNVKKLLKTTLKLASYQWYKPEAREEASSENWRWLRWQQSCYRWWGGAFQWRPHASHWNASHTLSLLVFQS